MLSLLFSTEVKHHSKHWEVFMSRLRIVYQLCLLEVKDVSLPISNFFVDKGYNFFKFFVTRSSPRVLYTFILVDSKWNRQLWNRWEDPFIVEETLPDRLLLKTLECWFNALCPMLVPNKCLHEVQRNASCSFLVLIFSCYTALTVV